MMWFLRYGAQWTELFVILDHSLPFYPSKHLENKNFENMKKVPGDTIILHMPTINDNHMMYASWDWSATDFFVILGYFLPCYPLTTQKIKTKKKGK